MVSKPQVFKMKIVFIGIQLISIHVVQGNFGQGQICNRGEAGGVNNYVVTISLHQNTYVYFTFSNTIWPQDIKHHTFVKRDLQGCDKF